MNYLSRLGQWLGVRTQSIFTETKALIYNYNNQQPQTRAFSITELISIPTPLLGTLRAFCIVFDCLCAKVWLQISP